ncbi:hypothetical protein AQUCO_02500333v1 [Aquilegia coerulea]|uniref:Uncharacterized protein n=1 Tax=Aquilegia coerulea TaxID=218851 RepID=A0A2G5DAJ0_AQUCA|nr:hypothetical protein AQUCO_02500333v1 [Aquilegia coerulea]
MEKEGSYYKKGLWTEEEDKILMDYISVHGKGRWSRIARITGLKRCGKSCRLRWMNYLSPNVKKGDFSEEEEDLIIRLHKLLGNRWSLIAGRVPGRTDNQVKNHWNTHLSKKLGVKRVQHKASTSSLKVPREHKEERESLNLVTFSNPKISSSDKNDGVTEPIVDNHISSRTPVLEAFSTQHQAELNDQSSIVSSFWFNSDNLNLSAPSLVDVLLDGYSPDVIWNDLKF